jgi:putative toxin-antitoxin system antitoxin component (TIGR02293 family)
VAAVKQGLPVSAAEALGVHLDIPIRILSKVTNIPERTLLRRKREKEALKPDESERVMRIGLLLERAAEVLGGLDNARAWLKSPNRALGGSTPLDYADTEPGAREVESLLGRLEHGVFT